MRHDAVFDRVNLPGGVTEDLDQHVRLIAQQVREQFGRRAERLTMLDRRAQPIDRAQLRRPDADDDPLGDVEGDRCRRRSFRGEELDVVDHREQRAVDDLDAGRGQFLDRIVEGVGQRDVLAAARGPMRRWSG